MDANPSVIFVLVGFLDLGPNWQRMANRIERHPFMHYSKLLELAATLDVNLAPLEVGNPFCEAKSELKYFEAAIVRVPTIASGTHPFVQAIESGKNGYIARTNDEWLEALEKLRSSPDLRAKIGSTACQRAVVNFGPEALRGALSRVYDLSAARPLKKDLIDFCWIIPDILVGGGGHRMIFRACAMLESAGYNLKIYVQDTNRTSADLTATVRKDFYPLKTQIEPYQGTIEASRAIVSTFWKTAYTAKRHANPETKLIYFVQDYEPYFYPMGRDFILAENSYRLGFHHLCVSPWIFRKLQEDFDVDAEYLEMPIDRKTYYSNATLRTPGKILFLAKPDTPRRCFELGIETLKHLSSSAVGLDIHLYGSDDLRTVSLPFKATVHGVMRRQEALAELYRSSTLGLVFSPTNPSLVPYEMMACGLPVVDLNLKGASQNYGGTDRIAYLGDVDPQTLSREIVWLMDHPEELEARRRAGIEFTNKLPSEEQMATRVVSIFKQYVGDEEPAAGKVMSIRG
jgi:glycosyltransferase involved in cell wall biosynthesis